MPDNSEGLGDPKKNAADQVNKAAAAPAPVAGDGQAAHPEYYSKVELRPSDDPRRLDVVRTVGSQPPPTVFRDFLKQVQEVARLVVVLFPADVARRRDLFGQLHVTADSGLRGPNSSIEVGLDNLNDVKNAIADEFPAIREVLWRKNLIFLLVMLASCLPVGGAIYYYFAPSANGAFDLWVSLAIAVFWIPLGVALGLFLEFVFRVGDDLPYEQLRSINPGRWKPVQRGFNTVVVAYTFAGILAIGAFQVGVANVLLNDFIDKKPFLSLAIGFVTGIAFPYVRDLVQQFRPVRREG